ncbi:hypothetical protein [Trueperella pecoris]|uniref:Uncharacterized protein n=1 Tax=Trueperella pecoris TaxID=2733571 RepID=A0A7M1QUV4_9ACTO|nr:hypothetical protein [Trueperella pecoris]QOQ39665.1 hypothetical protein HLG82_09580 [Trueperella pecoris]QOR45708.1 hypothetical protein INS88_00255 [Trueperella pecoris]QTG75548.1 hypothetical protein J4179_00255 [Trueperella pecoris]
MTSRTELVAHIGQAGAVPANRPIDRARRIVTAATIGSFFGTLAALIWFLGYITLAQMLLAMIPSAVLLLAFVVVWRIPTPSAGDPIPVVARTLATSESPYRRYIKSGSNKGLLVPVVVQPVDGSEAFRSVILLRETVPGHEVPEPEVGTLLALQQVEKGMGELANIGEVTPEQEELRERLVRHPRQLSNRAPALPMRRGTLERQPLQAALEWWGFLVLSVIFVWLYCWVIL